MTFFISEYFKTELSIASAFPFVEVLIAIILFADFRAISFPQSPTSLWEMSDSLSAGAFRNIVVPIISSYNLTLIPYSIFISLSVSTGLYNGSVGSYLLFGLSKLGFLVYKTIAAFVILFFVTLGTFLLSMYLSTALFIPNILLTAFIVMAGWDFFIISTGIFAGIISRNPAPAVFISLLFAAFPELFNFVSQGNMNSGGISLSKAVSGGAASISYATNLQGVVTVIYSMIILVVVSLLLILISYFYLNFNDMRAGR